MRVFDKPSHLRRIEAQLWNSRGQLREMRCEPLSIYRAFEWVGREIRKERR